VGGLSSGIYYFLEPFSSISDSLTKPISLFGNVLVEIERGYVDKVDQEKLFETVSDLLNEKQV